MNSGEPSSPLTYTREHSFCAYTGNEQYLPQVFTQRVDQAETMAQPPTKTEPSGPTGQEQLDTVVPLATTRSGTIPYKGLSRPVGGRGHVLVVVTPTICPDGPANHER